MGGVLGLEKCQENKVMICLRNLWGSLSLLIVPHFLYKFCLVDCGNAGIKRRVGAVAILSMTAAANALPAPGYADKAGFLSHPAH